MKHIWKVVLLVVIVAIFQATYSKDIGVSKIDVLDKNTLKVTLSENPNLKVGENDADIKILDDVKVKTAIQKEGSLNEVELTLEDPLLPLTKYSLLTVSGADGSIDFTTPSSVEGYTQENLASTADQDIENIEILDASTIIVRYVQNISGTTYDFKLLAENNVVKVEKPTYDAPEIIITVEPPLLGEQDYILMVVDMKDVDGKQLQFDTGIYDFTTPLFPAQEDTVTATGTLDESLTTDLTAAPITSLEKENTLGETASGALLENSVEAVAQTVTETPETGATTWILIVITLFINSFLFFTRRKKA